MEAQKLAMKRMDGTLRKRVVGALAGLVAVAAFVPAVAWAQVPVARLTMYEVLEALQLKKPTQRFASAALLGNRVVPLQPDPFFAAATNVGAEATSKVNINPGSRRFGTGPIQGDFQLLTLMDLDSNGEPNLSDLVVVARGHLEGTLDLRPALIPDPATGLPSPYAPVSGTWNLKHDGRKPGSFAGAFLIPFRIPGVGGHWYLNPAELEITGLPSICLSGFVADFGFGPLCALDPVQETLLGFPLTKAVIYLNE